MMIRHISHYKNSKYLWFLSKLFR